MRLVISNLAAIGLSTASAAVWASPPICRDFVLLAHKSVREYYDAFPCGRSIADEVVVLDIVSGSDGLARAVQVRRMGGSSQRPSECGEKIGIELGISLQARSKELPCRTHIPIRLKNEQK